MKKKRLPSQAGEGFQSETESPQSSQPEAEPDTPAPEADNPEVLDHSFLKRMKQVEKSSDA